ncbi:hypothetical protein [Streptomyces nodosus]|uniref:hypothetical protein n=1 Tax=Streptomyces nodosus TaxID=40318 RepID=UPI00069467E1|nr:hypothetical protein [Streptomyces nodosus]MBB4790103.1 hypothetical protein [Streptomyces nodosus]
MFIGSDATSTTRSAAWANGGTAMVIVRWPVAGESFFGVVAVDVFATGAFAAGAFGALVVGAFVVGALVVGPERGRCVAFTLGAEREVFVLRVAGRC